ncbi:MAG: alpha-D-ribose 1-methylphosphonate 5-phosphate C-P-lyase PhnJ [Pseudonocardiaceae bacterium]
MTQDLMTSAATDGQTAATVPSSTADLMADADRYSFAFLDELSKREIRRTILSAVAIPGYQVPFASRDMPVARGWGSGGLQITLGIVGAEDVVKVIDQGDDAGVNAANLRRLIQRSTGVDTTLDRQGASIVQTRHRLPEEGIPDGQVLVLQVPNPESLKGVERRESELRRMHAEADYSRMWVALYEDYVRHGAITKSTGYPVLVNGRYVMQTSPIPRWDVPRLHHHDGLALFGAGREKRIYAVPPHTDVVPLTFEDIPFEVERYPAGTACARCGSTQSYLSEIPGPPRRWLCSDTDWCDRRTESPS